MAHPRKQAQTQTKIGKTIFKKRIPVRNSNTHRSRELVELHDRLAAPSKNKNQVAITHAFFAVLHKGVDRRRLVGGNG